MDEGCLSFPGIYGEVSRPERARVRAQTPEGETFEADYDTSEAQALLYRLSGDLNPLHVDPELATKVGFKAPILHGLCTYGVATRAILEGLCNHDVSRLKSFTARFSQVVYPGDTLSVQILPSVEDGVYRLQVASGEQVVLSHGVVHIG